jgi:hypothetical protein
MTTHDDTTGLRSESSGRQAGFTPHNPHEDEARERWGHTDAWKQSQERVKKMSKEDFAKIGQEGDALLKKIAALAAKNADPASPEVQILIAQHYANLRHFYEPNLEMYRGLADMYVADARFTATFDKYRPGLALFLQKAMHAFCDAGGEKKA